MVDNGDTYKTIQALYRARTYTGIGFWLVLRSLGLAQQQKAGPVSFGDYLTLGAPYWLAPILIVVMSVVLHSVTVPDQQRHTRGQLRTPVLCSLLMLLWFAVAYLALRWPRGSSGSVQPDSGGATLPQLLGFLFIGVPLILATFWVAGALICGFWISLRDQYRVIDGHPYLGAAVGLLTGWIAFGYGEIFGGTNYSVAAGSPSGLILAGTWGGVITVTSLSLYELYYLYFVLRIDPRSGSVPAMQFTG